MAIPSAGTIADKVLELIADGRPHAYADVVNAVVQSLGLSEAEKLLRVPSNRETLIANRVRNAKFRLRSRGLVGFDERNEMIQLTARGSAEVSNSGARR
jgi:restriction endonuclease Mrr